MINCRLLGQHADSSEEKNLLQKKNSALMQANDTKKELCRITVDSKSTARFNSIPVKNVKGGENSRMKEHHKKNSAAFSLPLQNRFNLLRKL
jgi:hypothetical protein